MIKKTKKAEKTKKTKRTIKTKRIIKTKRTKRIIKTKRTKRTKKIKKTIKTKKGGKGEAEVLELLKRKSFGDETIADDEIYALLEQVKNDKELYDAIFKINRQLKTQDQKDAFIHTAFLFQELPGKLHNRFPDCRFLPNCTRDNIVHKLSHTVKHPATLIAEAISALNK